MQVFAAFLVGQRALDSLMGKGDELVKAEGIDVDISRYSRTNREMIPIWTESHI